MFTSVPPRTTPPGAPAPLRLKRLALTCAAAAIALALCALVGWAADVPVLRTFAPGAVSMKANSAVCFLLLGAALTFQARGRTPQLARAAAGAAALLALAVLSESLLSVDLGIDQLLFADAANAAGTPAPGRMAPNTSAAVLLVSLALALDGRYWRGSHIPSLAALAAIGLAFATLTGYILGVSSLLGLPGVTQMALPAASAVLLLACGVLLTRPRVGAMGLLTSPAAGGRLARRLLPTAVGVPFVVDVFRVAALDAGLLDEQVADWLFLLCVTGLLTAVIVRLARRLEAAHETRLDAERRLRSSERVSRSVIDRANAAIVEIDGSGVITLFNPASERLFGWAGDEVVGRHVSRLLPERGHASHAEWMRTHTMPGSSSAYDETVELAGIARDGTEFDMEVSFAGAREDGQAGFIAIIRDITQRKREHEATRVDAERLAQVVDAQVMIAGASGDMSDVMRTVAERAREIAGADGAVVELPEGDELVYRSTAGPGAPALGTRTPIGASLAGLAYRSGKAQHCRDTDLDDRVDGELCRRLGLRSMICVPLRHRHHVVGVLKVLSPVPDAFDERDERALELVGGLAAAAVHRAQSDRQLAAHHTVARALAEAGSLSGGVSGALRGLGEALGWDFGALWLATEDGATLQCQDVWHLATVPAAPYGRAARDSAPVRGEGTIGGVWDTCRPSWVEDIRAQAPVPADGARAESAASAHLRTIVDVAVVANGEVLGVLELAAREERAEDPEMEDLVAVVAAQIGQFVQRKRAQNHIREQAENLSSVVELAQSIGRLRDPARFRPALCTAMRDVTGADQVALFELDDSGERLVLTAQKGDHLADGLVLAVDGPSAVATAFRTGEGDYVADTSNDARVDRDVARSSGLRTAFLEPLLRDGEAIGVVSISWHRLQRTDPAGKRTLMRLLAAESANALERADLVVMLDASARTDQLTGVANRRAWDDELGRELARSQRAGTPLCLALIDLDHFKAYNDTHGHPAGDRLLRESAARWDARLRTTDLLSRYGGEEFAVLLPGCRDGVAGAVADDLRTAMPAGATCSIGVAQWDGIESAEALVARVDAALYDAKDQGRDRVVVAGGGARATAA